jgi:hypothetical protein
MGRWRRNQSLVITRRDQSSAFTPICKTGWTVPPPLKTPRHMTIAFLGDIELDGKNARLCIKCGLACLSLGHWSKSPEDFPQAIDRDQRYLMMSTNSGSAPFHWARI